MTSEERKARLQERLNRPALPPMNAGLGCKGKAAIEQPADVEIVDEVEAPKPKGNKTRGKQALSIVGDVNQRALERIAKDFKKHPTKLTPLEVLIDIAADVSASNSARLSAATAAAPYLHKKMTSFTDEQEGNAAEGRTPPVIIINEMKNHNEELRQDLEKELNDAINASKGGT